MNDAWYSFKTFVVLVSAYHLYNNPFTFSLTGFAQICVKTLGVISSLSAECAIRYIRLQTVLTLITSLLNDRIVNNSVERQNTLHIATVLQITEAYFYLLSSIKCYSRYHIAIHNIVIPDIAKAENLKRRAA